jgi:hypothetical protein
MNAKRRVHLAAYYDRHGVLGGIEDEPVAFSLDDQLRQQILHGKRGRRLQNVSIKLDAVQVQALRKLATLRSIPYQTLIRQLLAEGIRRELRLAG